MPQAAAGGGKEEKDIYIYIYIYIYICIKDLIIPERATVPKTFLLPREIAQAWYWRSIQSKGLSMGSIINRKRTLLLAINQGLIREWRTRWSAAPEVAAAKAAFPVVGKNYFMPKPRNRFQFSTFLRFLTSDVFLGTLHLPRDDWYDLVCPICGDDLSREHVLQKCPGLAIERELITRHVSRDQLTDWNWVVSKGEHLVCRFLVAVQHRFSAVGLVGARSSELLELSPRVGLDISGD